MTIEQAIETLKRHQYNVYASGDKMYLFTIPQNTTDKSTMVAMSEETVIRKAQQLEDDGA
jgi:hypothetical protein